MCKTHAGGLEEVVDSSLGDMHWEAGHCCTAHPCLGQLEEACGHLVDDYSHDG